MRINPNAFLATLFILICAQVPRLVQDPREMSPLTSVVARAIKNDEADWNYTPGHCTCPPLISPQESANLGIWERRDKKGELEQLIMEIYEIPSVGEAFKFIRGYDSDTYKGPCRVQRYELGDEASLLDCSAVHISENTKVFGGPMVLWLRKDNFLISVNGNSEGTVVRFAKYALRVLPPTNAARTYSKR
jgi:hypothetical protein